MGSRAGNVAWKRDQRSRRREAGLCTHCEETPRYGRQCDRHRRAQWIYNLRCRGTDLVAMDRLEMIRRRWRAYRISPVRSDRITELQTLRQQGHRMAFYAFASRLDRWYEQLARDAHQELADTAYHGRTERLTGEAPVDGAGEDWRPTTCLRGAIEGRLRSWA